MKQVARAFVPAELSVCTMVYIPSLTDYWAQSFDTLKACLNACRIPAERLRVVTNADHLPEEAVIRALGPKMACATCGYVGADVRPDWSPLVNKRHL